MRLRLLPIILMLFGIAGLVLFATTPVVLTRAHYQGGINNADLVISMKVFFGGNGEVTIKGEYAGSPEDFIGPVSKNNWDSYFIDVEPYPDIVIYLAFIGLGLTCLGTFFSIFGYNDGLRIAGAILGILGAGIGIVGCFLLYNWNTTFQAEAEAYMNVNSGFLFAPYTLTYSTFGPGWLAAVISSGIIAIGSVLLLIIKPKK